MSELEPINLQPLVDSYPTAEGAHDLILGEGTRVDFGNGIVADVYAQRQVLHVETPISLFKVVGVHTVEVSPHAVEFHAQQGDYKAVLTFFTDGGMVAQVMPTAPPLSEEVPIEPEQQKATHLRLIKPGEPPEPTSELDTIKVKANFGRDPRAVTTEQGQMYFYPLAIHHANERQQPREKQHPQWVKVGVPIGQEALIINPELRSETNPKGLRFREGDFTQQVLEPGEWTELSANKTTGELRGKQVQGYFLRGATMLRQKQR